MALFSLEFYEIEISISNLALSVYFKYFTTYLSQMDGLKLNLKNEYTMIGFSSYISTDVKYTNTL